jgi:hypothetical protein
MSRIPGLLEAKVNVGLMAELEPLVAVAEKSIAVPSCTEVLVLGVRVIFRGKGEAPGGLLPPHAGKNRNKEIVTTTHAH